MWISPSTLLEHVLELDDPANPAVCDLDRSKVPATAPLVRRRELLESPRRV